MKKNMMVTWAVSAVLSAVIAIPSIGKAGESGTTLFSDDFESYPIDTFPSAGGWILVWNGKGTQHQVVSDAYSFTGEKSLQLWGKPSWSSVAQRKFSTDAPVIGYECAIRIDSIGTGGPGREESVCFFNRDVYVWGRGYAAVLFNHDDGEIKAEDGTVLGDWEPGVWYQVKVVLDRSTNTYSTWIDGQLKGEGLSTTHSDTELIDALALMSGHPGVKVYYDDARVFTHVGDYGDTAQWKVDFQGDEHHNNTYGQTDPVDYTEWGVYWNIFEVPALSAPWPGPTNYTTNPSMNLVDSEGNSGLVTFSIIGDAYGWAGDAGDDALTGDYLIILNGFGVTNDPTNWEITGLVPGTTYRLTYYHRANFVDRGINFVANGIETTISVPGSSVASALVTTDFLGRIRGTADSNGYNEGNWSALTITSVATTASNPHPADGATDVPIDVVLSWEAGSTAVSHDVYFGTSSPPVFVGNYDAEDYSPGGLEPGTTYYWKINEVEADGITIHTGDIWEFTTMTGPVKATNPSPADGAEDVPTGVLLSWDLGYGATSHDVYFGTSSPPVFVGNYAADSYDPGGLEPCTTYYWKINEVVPTVDGPPIIIEGDLWSFTAVCINVAPIVDIGPDQIVNEGDVVVFSPDFTDPDELDSHTATWDFGDGTSPVSWPYKKCKFRKDGVCPAHRCEVDDEIGICEEIDGRCVCVDPVSGEILVTHTYGDAGVYTVTLIVEDDNGGVGYDEMSVTVLPTVDDFESYVDHADLGATWKDGSVNGTGSTVGLSTDPVHGGLKAMKLAYNNLSPPYYSETEMEFDTPQDWTRYGVKALSLWFHAEPNNDAEYMYVGIGDGTNEAIISECECENYDIGYDCVAEWVQCDIELAKFSASGIDLTNVRKMCIGVGDRDASQPSGTGTLYFDDIRLYPARCQCGLLADLNCDCVVDFRDLEIMARQWLVSGSGLKADLYADDKVDLKDLAILGDLWLEVQLWTEEVPTPVVVFPKDGSILTGTELVIAGLLNDDKLAPYEISRVKFQCSHDAMTWSTFDESASPMDNFWSSNFDEWDASWDTSTLLPGPYLIRIEMDTIYGQAGTSEPISVTVNLPPVPQAVVLPGWPPGSVTLDASASFDPDGSVDAYMWDLGDGTTAEGATVNHVYTLDTTYDVVLTVADNAGVLTSTFYQLFVGELVMLTPAPKKCICTSIELRGDDLPAERDALGPDGQDGGTTWPTAVDKNGRRIFGGDKLGPLHSDPNSDTVSGEKNATGYAFEIVAEVDGDPKHCKQIQLVKATTVAPFSKQECDKRGGKWDPGTSKCTYPTRWSGTTSDIDLDGKNEIDVSSEPNCIAAGGTWQRNTNTCENIPFPQSGTKYKPDGPNDDEPFYGYRKPFTFKTHPDSKIIWFDSPNVNGERFKNGTSKTLDFITIIKGTDCKYCYVKFTLELARKAGKDKEELKETEKKVGADEPPTVPKVP